MNIFLSFKREIVIFFFIIFHLTTYSQAPSIEWQRCYGGNSFDTPYFITRTIDHSYLLLGITNSTNGDVSGNHGNYDIWIVKIDSLGDILWKHCYGGSSDEFVAYAIEDNDGSIYITGSTTSNNGNVAGNHGSYDGWLLKLDSAGNLLWQHCYGGSQGDLLGGIVRTPDGLLICGATRSTDGDVSGCYNCPNGGDTWVIKTDTSGTLQWQRCYGGSGDESGGEIIKSHHQSYYFIVRSESGDGDVSNAMGGGDIWIVDIDSAGSILWNNCFGNNGINYQGSTVIKPNGDFEIAGSSSQSLPPDTLNHGGMDFWLANYDSTGIELWVNSYGGSQDDWLSQMCKTSDGGYAAIGITSSNDFDVSGNHSQPIASDVWVIKVDSLGALQWQKCLGGVDIDQGHCILETSDSGLLILSEADSFDGDLIGSGTHGADFWLVKLSSSTSDLNSEINPITDFNACLNSSNGLLSLSFYANGNEHLEMQLVDITGRLILSQPLPITVGFNSPKVYTGKLSAGVFVVRLINKGSVVFKKLIVQ
ncbi:lipoprotein [soil metagenome]